MPSVKLRLHIPLEGLILTVLLISVLGFTNPMQAEEESVLTTIILVNSEAVLVDLDERGEVLQQHIFVEDYFSSSQSHEALVRRSISRMRGLSAISPDKPNEEENWYRSKRLKVQFYLCASHYLSSEYDADVDVRSLPMGNSAGMPSPDNEGGVALTDVAHHINAAIDRRRQHRRSSPDALWRNII